MEETLAITPSEPALCASCYANVAEADAFCDNCGYPIKGTEEEQQFFKNNRIVKEIDLADYQTKIIKAGNKLFWIAGFFAFGGFIMFLTSKDDQETNVNGLIVCLVISFIFVALGAWSRKKPLAALVSGAALYGIVVILAAISNPLTIISGIIWKIIIIGAFVQGIKAAIEADKIKKEFNIE